MKNTYLIINNVSKKYSLTFNNNEYFVELNTKVNQIIFWITNILLKTSYELKQNLIFNKIIINISSRITDWPVNLKEAPAEYYNTKLRQDKFCTGKTSLPQILNLRVGMTDTPRVKKFTRNKMNANDVINVVQFALNSKLRISSITFGL